MVRFSSKWLIAPLVSAAVVAVMFADPTEVESDADEFHSGTSLQTVDSEAKDPESRDRLRQLSLRISYKETLIKQLIEGQLSLNYVTREFLALNKDIPSTMAVIRSQYSELSDEEANARNVLDYVRTRTEMGDSQQQVLCRLEREYCEKYGHHSY